MVIRDILWLIRLFIGLLSCLSWPLTKKSPLILILWRSTVMLMVAQLKLLNILTMTEFKCFRDNLIKAVKASVLKSSFKAFLNFNQDRCYFLEISLIICFLFSQVIFFFFWKLIGSQTIFNIIDMIFIVLKNHFKNGYELWKFLESSLQNLV